MNNNFLDRLNLPNRLTFIRILIIPVFVVFMLLPSDSTALRIISLILFCAASITDFFDGKIARDRHLVTNFGKFVDPLADKILVCSALICLVTKREIPAWVVIIIIAREFIISGLRVIAAEKGIVISASIWGKIKTVSQMILVILLILDFGRLFHVAGIIFTYIALILTIVSGADYIIKNKEMILNDGM